MKRRTREALRAGRASRASFNIVVTADQAEVVDQAEAALLMLGGVYVRGRTLVHVVRDVGESDGLVYPAGQLVIARVGKERLRELCGMAARWCKPVKNGYSEPCMVPVWVAKTLLERGEWRFPALNGISDVPVFRANGTIQDKPGYDPMTRTIYEPGSVRFPPIPDAPSHFEAVQALETLKEPFSDFSFVEDSDLAAVVALVLTLVARPAIDGCTPMFLVRAPVPGSGKGLVVDTVSVIATGRDAPKRAPATNDDELRKAMLAYALASPPLVVLDNVEGPLGSPLLAMVLTAGAISDRLLGVSEDRTVPVRFVMAATGNNVQVRGDTGRRVVPIDLDPRCEHPEDRSGWRHENLRAYVRAERQRFVVAALTMLRAYVIAGEPGHGRPTKGSYEAWDRRVRGAIIWAGGADPLGGAQRIRHEGDEDLERMRDLLAAWHVRLGDQAHSIASAIKCAGRAGDLHEALAAYCKNGNLEPRALGYAFKKLRGRICGGLELVSESGHAGTCRWRVRAADGGDGGHGGDVPATPERESVPSV
jgi:hypothetical protein